MVEKKKRQANFELLRIIAMMMVIVLHYIAKGNLSQKLSVDRSITNHLWWLIQGFCNVAVNVYILISGYFLVDAQWKIHKLIKLVCQVLFYSITVGLVVYAFGAPYDLTSWLNIILPIEYEHYWFATAYVVMYILSPILAIAVKNMPQKQLKTVIIALLCFFCLPKSINPYLIPTDSYGYDFGWFICLFLIAGYIRCYGIKLFDSKKKSIFVYVITVTLNWMVCSVTGWICYKTGKLEYYMDMTYAYNYILVLISSIAMFYVWTFVEIKPGKGADIVCKISALTFGVYLLHENVGIRLRWPYLLGVDKINAFPLQLLHMIFSVIVVFAFGCVVDYIRSKIFNLFDK